MVDQVGFFIDLNKCIGCHSCTVQCKSENNTNLNLNYRWVIIVNGGTYPLPKRYFVSMACNQCEEPACAKACPLTTMDSPAAGSSGNPNNNAIVKRGVNGGMDKNDGVVYIDDSVCNGCKRCVAACPYGAPQFNKETQRVEKCHYCMHRLDAGLTPACAQTCVGMALSTDTLANIKTNNADAVSGIKGYASPDLTKPSTRFRKIPGID